MRHSWLLALAVLCAAPTPGVAQTYVINTMDGLFDDNWRDYLTGMRGDWGSRFVDGQVTSRSGYGQTFTLQVGSTLDRFGMRADACIGMDYETPGNCVFRAFIARWEDVSRSAGRTTGVLWAGPALPLAGPVPTFTPSVWLEPGKYVAYFMPQGVPPTPGYTGILRSMYTYQEDLTGGSVAYPGGELVGFFTRDPSATGGEAEWARFYNEDVAQFRAELTTTPEPASLALMGTGLAALAGAARRRRRREAAAE